MYEPCRRLHFLPLSTLHSFRLLSVDTLCCSVSSSWGKGGANSVNRIIVVPILQLVPKGQQCLLRIHGKDSRRRILNAHSCRYFARCHTPRNHMNVALPSILESSIVTTPRPFVDLNSQQEMSVLPHRCSNTYLYMLEGAFGADALSARQRISGAARQ